MSGPTSTKLLRSVFSQLGSAQLRQYVARGAQLFSQVENLDRPGEGRGRALDPLPLILSEQEQSFLGQGLAEWAQILEKAYRSLRSLPTFTPPGAIHQVLWQSCPFDPGLNGLLAPTRSPLSVLRFDLVKVVGHGWRVQALGTGTPRGLGLALETRVLHGQVFTPLVNRSQVIRLAPFFRSLKQEWHNHALHHVDDPAVMVWSPGPGDPDYPEYVYLCRYFGFPLVESRDLTVRSGKVFLKMLGGLRPVDVLIRAVGDRAIDPLCGNPPPFDGVAGLAQALRDGEVFVDNAPGSDVLSRPEILLPLGSLAPVFLEKDLAIPPWDGTTHFCKEPFWFDGKWESKPFQLSLFLAKLEGTWQCLPGGFARLRESPSSPNRNPLRPHKDVWFLSGSSVPFESLLPQRSKPSAISRSADLPSRVADDLFWLGRYAERAWVDVRFLGKGLEMWGDDSADPVYQHQGRLLKAFISHLNPGPAGTSPPEEEAPWPLWDTLKDMKAIASRVRDRFSMETHRVIADLAALVPDDPHAPPRPLREILDQTSILLAAFNGLANENMTRGAGWRFLDMGKRIERARLLTEAAALFCSPQAGADELALFLELFDSLITYRNRYYFAAELGPVIDLLILDESNPRSVAFQVLQLEDHLEKIPHDQSQAYRGDGERHILKLLTDLRLAEGPLLAQDPGTGDQPPLADFLAAILTELDAVSQSVHRRYLAKIEELQRLQASTWGDLS